MGREEYKKRGFQKREEMKRKEMKRRGMWEGIREEEGMKRKE